MQIYLTRMRQPRSVSVVFNGVLAFVVDRKSVNEQTNPLIRIFLKRVVNNKRNFPCISSRGWKTASRQIRLPMALRTLAATLL